jgi:mannose-6-phosphate isomerase-like protein (cupin superfamily)
VPICFDLFGSNVTVKPVVLPAGAAQMKELRYGRGLVEMLVGTHNGAQQVDLHLNVIRPGTPPGPRHLHTKCENVYYVLSGRGSINIADDDHAVTAGDVIFIPPGVPHSASNVGEEELRLLEIYAPADVDFVEV